MEQSAEETIRMNNELLKVANPGEDSGPESEVKKPKRNSKEELLAKILKVVEKYELDFDYSDTKLKRMNKQELTKILAHVMEDSVKIDMARSVGVDPRANGKVVTLGALRMIHNLCATGFEKVFNTMGSKYTGYELREVYRTHVCKVRLTSVCSKLRRKTRKFYSTLTVLTHGSPWCGAALY